MPIWLEKLVLPIRTYSITVVYAVLRKFTFATQSILYRCSELHKSSKSSVFRLCLTLFHNSPLCRTTYGLFYYSSHPFGGNMLWERRWSLLSSTHVFSRSFRGCNSVIENRTEDTVAYCSSYRSYYTLYALAIFYSATKVSTSHFKHTIFFPTPWYSHFQKAM